MEAIRTLEKVNEVAILIIEINEDKLVPINPICEALGIDYSIQVANLKKDDFLCSLINVMVATGSDGKAYELVCLPYKYIFGWLLTIDLKNLKEKELDSVSRYRIECYDALYRDFTARSTFLQEKNELLEKHIENVYAIRNEFTTAKERLAEAKRTLNKIKEFTFEQWKFNNRQLVMDFENAE